MQDQPAAVRRVEGSPNSGPALNAQQLFERERARQSTTVGGSLRSLGRALAALGRHADSRLVALPTTAGSVHLAGLVEHGAVILHGRRTPSGRRWIDHLVVAPSGVYVVEDRAWRGQVAVSGEWLYVDGRTRSGVPEAVRRTAEAAQQALAEELEPLGLGVTPVLCLPAANETWRPLSVHGVAVFTCRGLPRYVRQAEPLLGRDTVVRLALAADRLLEHAPPARAS